MIRAFAYVRVSGKGQVKGDGFPRQLSAIRQYAKAHGIRIRKVFREEGVSGTKNLEDRPALSEMLGGLHSNIKLVLIEKLDRLAPDLIVQETIIGDLRKDGIELISVMEPDLVRDDPTRKLLRKVFGAIAEYEKSMIVIKLRAARNRVKARKGRCEGRKPYGFYPGEKGVVERMKVLRAEPLGFDRLAAKLNAEGFRTRKGTPWHGFAVNRILSRRRGASRTR